MTIARRLLIVANLVATAALAQAQTGVDEAVTLVEKRQYAEAKLLLKAAVAADPSDPRATAYLAIVRLNHDRDADGAIELAEKAVALAPATSRYQVWLGSIYLAKAGQSGLLKAASLAGKGKAAYERAVALDPSSVEARQALLQYYLNAPGVAGGSVAKAREQATAIGALDAHGGRLAAARIADHEKEWPAAEAAYREALKLQPERASTHNSLGYALLHQKRYEDAVAAFRRYVELAPDDANAHDSLGEGLLAAGRTAEAEASYRRATEVDPAFAPSVWGLGECLAKLGRRDDARVQYRRYLELAPQGPHAEGARKRVAKP